jgi:predicted Fe-Mo cluster-binding NifX family protein
MFRNNKGEPIMKIAIPLVGGKLSQHFGHCEEFVLLEICADAKTITGKSLHQPPPHEPGMLPRWLNQLGAEVIIAGGMGRRAQELFTENGIKVVVGAAAEAPEKLVNAYLQNTLEVGENCCDH